MTRCLLIALLLVCLPTAPGWAEVKNTDDQFAEVEAIEGRAPSAEGALRAAHQRAVEKVIKEAFLATPEELQRYDAVRATVLAEANQYSAELKMSDKYRDGSLLVVAVAGRINKEALRQRLLALKVIQDATAGMTAIQLPRLALRAVDGRSDYPTRVAVATVHHRLTEKRLALVDQAQQQKLTQEDRKIVGEAGTGPALSSADIELAIRADVAPTQAFGELQMYQAAVVVEAYIPGLPTPFAREVYQSRELAFQSTADRKKSQAACVEEAIGGAMSPLMTRVMRELQAERDSGKTGAIKVFAPVAHLDRIEKKLRGQFPDLQATIGDGHRLFVARLADRLDDVLEDIANDPTVELVGQPERGARQALIRLKAR